MAREWLARLFCAPALLGHRTARPELSRPVEMVGRAKQQRTACLAGAEHDQSRSALQAGAGECRPLVPMGAGRNPQSDPPRAQTTWLQRAHSLEHEKPDAQ